MNNEQCPPCHGDCQQGRTCPKRVSKWQEEAEYWADDSAPAWWEIAIALIVMVLVIAVIIVSSWRLG